MGASYIQYEAIFFERVAFDAFRIQTASGTTSSFSPPPQVPGDGAFQGQDRFQTHFSPVANLASSSAAATHRWLVGRLEGIPSGDQRASSDLHHKYLWVFYRSCSISWYLTRWRVSTNPGKLRHHCETLNVSCPSPPTFLPSFLFLGAAGRSTRPSLGRSYIRLGCCNNG